MTKVEALKKLAVALGIVDSTDSIDATTISEVINEIGKNYNAAPKELVLSSSTPDSTKKFKITVVDNGTISATEITETNE